jgi:plastocyanin
MSRTRPARSSCLRSAARSAAAVLLASAASAQQFQHQAGAIPGTPRWTEGVECADVDNDGDLDLLFADGDGFSSPGTARQNVLVINQFVPSGILSFTDESVARLGANVSHAKSVVTRDVDGDGWVDLLFCNAFDLEPPLLYINQGAANPGFFTLESSARGLTTILSSGSAQFGDVDDDGDPDLLINNGYLGQSRKPKLYLNDGLGFFTDDLGRMAAAGNKQSQMDVQLADMDGDWDLDFVGLNRASNPGGAHYLMLNDGAGTFTNATATIPSNSGNTYEGEVGDLDGDADLDLFLVSSTGFGEGAIRNDLAQGGTLALVALPALADGNDDNEIALFDWDVDGDYDALVGSLSGSREAFWRNDGGLSFANVSVAAITAISDSTLDCTVADLDNDGRHDIVTAQGESNPGQYANKVYRNTGAPDSLPPVVVAIDSAVVAAPTGPFKVRAKVRDQVLDDGVDYLTGSANYVVLTADPAPQAVAIDPGGLSQAVVTISAGEAIRWTNNTGVAQTLQLASAPYDHVLGQPGAGAALEQRLVHPGSYSYTVAPAGFAGTIQVNGTDVTVATGASGGQIHRALLADTAAGSGVRLAFELVFADWAGNVEVTPVRSFPLAGCTATTYCTAKMNSFGCIPAIGSIGIPSASAGSGFVIRGTNLLNLKNGLLFYGTTGPAAQPFQGGTMCVAAPRLRTQPSNSGGTQFGVDCSGVLSFDFNAFVAGPTPIPLQAGTTVHAQFWSRDPGDNHSTSLTDAIQFTLCN